VVLVLKLDSYQESFEEFDFSVLTALLRVVNLEPEKAALAVLEHFPNFQLAARADFFELAEIIGVDGANLLRTIPRAVVSMTRETLLNTASYIVTLEAVRTHMGALLNGRRNEVLAVIYLNSGNRLLGEDLLEGSIDRISIYPREIVRRCLILNASSVVIAHNHPSGDNTPSRSDIKATIILEKALNLVDVVLLDHIVFGECEPYSLRENFDF